MADDTPDDAVQDDDTRGTRDVSDSANDGRQNDDAAHARGGKPDGRRKPQFSEEQNRWIGGLQARSDERRRAVEAERDAANEKVTNLTGRTETLERDLRLSRAENAVITAATKAGAAHPELVFRAVRDDLQFGDDGKPKDVAALIERYKTDYPSLFAAAARSSSGADGGKGGGDQGGERRSMNEMIRAGATEARGRILWEGGFEMDEADMSKSLRK